MTFTTEQKKEIVEIGGLLFVLLAILGLGYFFMPKYAPDPLVQLGFERSSIQQSAKADFFGGTLAPYDGEISDQWQSCINSETGDTTRSGKISAGISSDGLSRLSERVNQGDLTPDKILEEMGSPFIYAFGKSQIHWAWKGSENRHIFYTTPGKESLWYCYFKEVSPFFGELYGEENLSYLPNENQDPFSPEIENIQEENVSPSDDPLVALINKNKIGVSILWSIVGDNNENDLEYTLRYGQEANNLSSVKFLEKQDLSVIVSGLDPNTKYFFQIETSSGLVSEQLSFTTPSL